MKTFKVRATGMEFLPEIAINAESDEDAEEIYRSKLENGELEAYGYDLEIKIEGGE